MVEFKNIMLTTDLSENANAAEPYAVEFARQFDGRIELVHVFDPFQLTGSSREKRAQNLKITANIFQARDHVPINTILLEGQPVSELVNYAKSAKADCLVIATHGWTGLHHLLMGSVAERLVQLMPCPVFTVRPIPA